MQFSFNSQNSKKCHFRGYAQPEIQNIPKHPLTKKFVQSILMYNLEFKV